MGPSGGDRLWVSDPTLKGASLASLAFAAARCWRLEGSGLGYR